MDQHPLLTGARLAELTGAALTYPEVGATVRAGDLPAGYHHLRRDLGVGQGAGCFHRATEALLSWSVHRGAGLRVAPSSPRAAADVVADLRLGLGPLGLRAPVRVVDVVEGPRSRGFAYGTLPGHPETGEESFVVTIDEVGAVTFTVQAFSRPGSLLTRAVGPAGRWAQRGMTRRYARSLHRLVRDCA